MKAIKMKAIKIITILLLFSFKMFGQIPNCIEITSKQNQEQLTFTLPQYEIVDTSLFEMFKINAIYKYIKTNNEFGIVNDIGKPKIPQISYDIAIPSDAKNIEIKLINPVYENIALNDRLLPSQEVFENETNPEFIIDEDYYQTNGDEYNFNFQISENYSVFGQNGVTISIFPFCYNPNENNLTVLQKGTFVFSYTSEKQIKNENIVNDYATQNYLSNFFINYPKDNAPKISYGRYLIITAPAYENTLTYFANYKRNIGYTVEVVNTNTTGTSASDVKEYLQNRYDNSSTRPTFVLLVGDVTDIPASSGSTSSSDNLDDQLDDYKNPLTDFDYTRLDGNDYLSDIFIGRWSVSTIGELQNIINKTIVMETNIHTYNKEAVFLSGSGTGENSFKNSISAIVENTFEPDNWQCNELYAIDGATETDGLNALNDNNLYFIYRGHGNYLSTGAPFRIGVGDVTNPSLTTTIYPPFFSIACLTNCFGYERNSIQQPCLGEEWISSENGGVAFFGASTVTITWANNDIIKEIFDDENFEQEQLGTMVTLGMKNYKNAFWTLNWVLVRRHLKTYNLLGDPSFIYAGIGCIDNISFNNEEIFHDGDIVEYHASNTIETNNTFDVQTGSRVTLVAGESIVLKPGFHAGAGSNFHAYIAPCEDKEEEIIKTNTTLLKNNSNFIDTTRSTVIEKEASVFPNPFTNYILLNYLQKTTGEVIISIFDMTGNKIYEEITIENKGIIYHNINTSKLQSGAYIYNIKTETILYKGKIIKIN